MGQNIDNLLVRPLVYDVLDGEFHPASDPGKAHTLGRLLVASFLKGEYSLDIGEVEGDLPFAQFSYEPSWAPGVTAMSECMIIDWEQRLPSFAVPQNQKSYRFFAIELKKDGETLLISDETDDNVSQLFIGTGQGDKQHTLALGEDLVKAKLEVTKKVQAFFQS